MDKQGCIPHDLAILVRQDDSNVFHECADRQRLAIMSSAMVHPPRLAADAVARAVEAQFALTGNYTQLVSERDQNFRLTTTEGKRFVVKATGFAEDPVVTDFQIAALLYLEEQGVMGVPRIVRTVAGEDRGVITADDGVEICLRIVTWLDGQLLVDVGATPDIAGRIGESLADLNRALEGFSHDGESQHLLWDTQRAGELRGLLDYVSDDVTRTCVEEVLNDFDSIVLPALGDVPHQVIHNDANDENILLDADGNISGIIDFGDMMKAPRIVEISTSASYLRTTDDPLRLIEPFVIAYHRKNPLLDSEFELLFDLIRTRLSMTLIILYWRLEARDEDDPYRQKALAANRNALEFLQNLSGLGREAVTERLSQ
jgi:Ser/Thr protein kinase RdoA (MazF antagonist)